MISSPDLWFPPPQRLVLETDETHIWRAYLNPEPPSLRPFLDILSPDETLRADRFHFRKHRVRYVVARAVLRSILARYLQQPPHLLRFSYNQYGKPALAHETGDAPLRFNLSHSNGLALYAFTRGREIGLDVEFIREDFASIEIAERFFSPAEVATLRALPAHTQTIAFFNCWSRKEAYIKALGEGLSHPLHTFAVSLTPGQPATLLRTDNDPHEATRWTLSDIIPDPDFAAALAIKGTPPLLRHWQCAVDGNIWDLWGGFRGSDALLVKEE